MNGILKLHLTKLSHQIQLLWLRLLPMTLITSMPHKPHMLSTFELMCGRPLLMGNLPPPTSLYGDYLPVLTQTCTLLREYEEAILPQGTQRKPNTHSPGNYVFLKTIQPKFLTPSWTGPHFILLTTLIAAKLVSIVPWINLSRLKLTYQLAETENNSTLPPPEDLTDPPLLYMCAPKGDFTLKIFQTKPNVQ